MCNCQKFGNIFLIFFFEQDPDFERELDCAIFGAPISLKNNGFNNCLLLCCVLNWREIVWGSQISFSISRRYHVFDVSGKQNLEFQCKNGPKVCNCRKLELLVFDPIMHFGVRGVQNLGSGIIMYRKCVTVANSNFCFATVPWFYSIR